MLVDPSSSAAGSTVTGAIRQASQATGTSFNYLLATAQVESGLNPQAGASTSSARGLFQFIEQTWLGTLKQSGAALGYGRYADAISRTSSGHYQVNDLNMRAEILKLRHDPTANAVMAGAFTKSNADYLAAKLGRQPSEGELYIAHFLGAGGASRLISLAAANPSAKAADYFPHAANANPSIFFDRATRAPRSLAQVRDVLVAAERCGARGASRRCAEGRQRAASTRGHSRAFGPHRLLGCEPASRRFGECGAGARGGDSAGAGYGRHDHGVCRGDAADANGRPGESHFPRPVPGHRPRCAGRRHGQPALDHAERVAGDFRHAGPAAAARHAQPVQRFRRGRLTGAPA